ncbi:hypothetical protein LMG29542_06268 [Paraburkholderia humisilvae]|uniref:Uncharacterized protein n=2 Tax=Paraburkholderia humisilvae TaxID=627669 RepID=A0A6J5EYJ9_9BURK|nr:hypothetical protein LMG29542_06268 [Paraburkholderia humisilvae]
MRGNTSTPMVSRTSQSTRARQSQPNRGETAAEMAVVAGWSVIGATLGFIEIAGPPGIAAAVAEMVAIFCGVCVVALAAIVAEDLRDQR